MASSSSNTSSTSSSSSTTLAPSASRVLPIRAAASAANAALGVAPAGASASASAPGVAPPFATAPPVAPAAVGTASALNFGTASTTAHDVSRSLPPRAPRYNTSWGGTKNVPAPTNFFDRRRRGGRHQNSAGVSRARNSGAGSQNASRTPTEESGWAGWQTAADPTTTSTPVMWSTEVGSSSHQPWAWSKPLPYMSTRDPTPTDASPASATSSSTTPSSGITLVPDASGSAPAVVTSAHTAPKLDAPAGEEKIVDAAPEPDAPASTLSSAPKMVDAALEPDGSASTQPSAPAVETIIVDAPPEPDAPASALSSPFGVEPVVDASQEPDVTTFTTPSAPVVAKIVDAALEPANASASTPSSAPSVKTIADASAKTSAPGAAPTASAATSAPGAAPTTIPSLRNNWVAIHWGIVPRPVQQEAFGGNGSMPPVEAPDRPDPLCPWREQVPPQLSGVWPCWECLRRPGRVVARPCGHLTICVLCYCYANSNRFVCPTVACLSPGVCGVEIRIDSCW